MSNISDQVRKQRLLSMLPADGSMVGNTSLARQLNWDVELYSKIRNLLVEDGSAEIGPGRGGSLRLAQAKTESLQKKEKGREEAERRTYIQRERALYPPFLKSLGFWADAQGWGDKLVRQIADQGGKSTGGRLTRPDFIVYGYKKYAYTPGVIRDVETFEVKPLGARIEAVFETASHSRAATKSYLAIQVDKNDPTEDDLSRIEAECIRFGVGLILLQDPADYLKWEFRVDPVRREPEPEILDKFIDKQLSSADKEMIRRWIR